MLLTCHCGQRHAIDLRWCIMRVDQWHVRAIDLGWCNAIDLGGCNAIDLKMTLQCNATSRATSFERLHPTQAASCGRGACCCAVGSTRMQGGPGRTLYNDIVPSCCQVCCYAW